MLPGSGAMKSKPFFLKGLWPVALLAVFLGLAELPFAGFMADDFIQLGTLEGVSSCGGRAPFRLYDIGDGNPDFVLALKNAGAFPWFFAPDFRMAFFRPLSSALLALDHRWFGLHPLGYRVHGVIWFLLLAAGLGCLLQRLFPRGLASLALTLFIVSGIHGPLSWTATRHIVIAAALGVFGLYFHVRWRQDGWRAGRLLALAALALSLTAGEAALGALAFVFAYEAFVVEDSWRMRIRASLPPALLVLAYLLFYRLLGFGASASSGYLNPLAEPLRFLAVLPGRMAVILGGMVAGGNVDLWVLRPPLRPLMVLTGALLAALFAVLFRSAWKNSATPGRRTVRGLTAGAVLAAVPFSGTPIGSRCLVIPWIGGAAALAWVLHGWWTVLRRGPGNGRRLAGVACALLAFIHLALAPVQRLAAPFLLQRMMGTRLAAAMDVPALASERIAGKTVVLLNAPDIVVGLHSYFYRALFRLSMPTAWRVLAWAPCAFRFSRLDAHTLSMEAVGGEVASLRLQTGDIVRLQDMQASVTGHDANGITKAEFRFAVPLDDPRLYFLAWRDGRLQNVAPPSMGATLLLPAPAFEL
jgi:hypothetical protein